MNRQSPEASARLSRSVPAAASVVVADDHPALVAVIAELLGRSGFDVVGCARDGAEALALIESEQPAVAVLDVRMPRLSGLEVARHAATTSADTAIVFYTGYGDSALLAEALAAGVRGFVLKESPPADLVRAVGQVADGHAYVDPLLAGAVVRGRPGGPLTERERQTLSMLADGLSNDEIGGRLGISPETVRTHVRNAMAKLGAETRVQAVATALRQSIIS